MKKFTSMLCLALFAMAFVAGCGEPTAEEKAEAAAAKIKADAAKLLE